MSREINPVALVFILCCLAVTTARAEGDDRTARQLMNSQGCKACHKLEGDGGTTATSFEDIRRKLSRAEIRLKLVNPSGSHGKAPIPDFSHLSKEQIEALVDFIQPNDNPIQRQAK